MMLNKIPPREIFSWFFQLFPAFWSSYVKKCDRDGVFFFGIFENF